VRILWHSNSPNSASGYGVQTNLAVSRLNGADHQFAVSCNWAQEGFVGAWQTPGGDVPLLPKDGRVDDHGEGILPYHANAFEADAIITHYDAWVFKPDEMRYPWIPWYPVDCEELPAQISSRVQHAAMRITQTHHAVDRTNRVGLDAEYVPAAFDGRAYRPKDGNETRHHLGATDRFLVICVAANTGHPASPSRKSYPQIFHAFKLFLEHTPDAILYIHAHQKGQIDLGELAQAYGIEKNIVAALPYYLATGAYTADYMADIYSAADVLLSPSMGEGFGVPIIEAQACGTPVITGDWTAMSEITRTGIAISKDDAAAYPIVNYGTMYLPRPEAIRDALIEATSWSYDPADVSERVQEYEIEHVIQEHWLPTLAKLEDRLQKPVAPGLNRAARRRMKLADKQAVA
jgi:glycosyltransferase involved in cell wall biosynthesis